MWFFHVSHKKNACSNLIVSYIYNWIQSSCLPHEGPYYIWEFESSHAKTLTLLSDEFVGFSFL